MVNLFHKDYEIPENAVVKMVPMAKRQEVISQLELKV